MKIAVIGATGYVGNAVVKELAARGHKVTAFARNIDKVFAADNVTAVAADVTAADFADKLQGFDAVVSAFNPGWNNPNIGADFAKGAAAITEAAKAAAVPYLLVVGGAGSLYVAPGVQLIDTPEFPQEIFAGANAAAIAGIPAISVPCGFTGNGLPVGLQIMAKRYDEESVFRAAFAYEQTTSWHTMRPPVGDN